MDICRNPTICYCFKNTIDQESFNKILTIIFKLYFKKSKNKYGFSDQYEFCKYFLDLINRLKNFKTITKQEEARIKSLFLDKTLLQIFERLVKQIKGKLKNDDMIVFSNLFIKSIDNKDENKESNITLERFFDYLSGLSQSLSVLQIYNTLTREEIVDNLQVFSNCDNEYGVDNIIKGKYYTLLQKNNNWFLIDNFTRKIIGNSYNSIVITSVINGCKQNEGIKITRIENIQNDILVCYERIPFGGGELNYLLLNSGNCDNNMFNKNSGLSSFGNNTIFDNREIRKQYSSPKDDLIHLPPHPIKKEIIDIFSAEVVAGIVDVVATYLLQLYTKDPLMLALAGPTFEKVGFFGKEAIGALNDIRKGKSKSFIKGFKERFTNGLSNLFVDVLLHDPIYASIIYYGVKSSTINPAIISLIGYLAALPPLAILKHGLQVGVFHLFLNYLKLKGLTGENYYESRFEITGRTNPDCIFSTIGKQFNLENYVRALYSDQYYAHRIPEFCDKFPVLRMRTVDDLIFPQNSFKNLEVGLTLPQRYIPKGFSEYIYYFCAKNKLCKPINDSSEINKLLLKESELVEDVRIIFERQSLSDKDLMITLDTVKGENGDKRMFLELKTYKNIELLCEAMFFILCGEYNVRTTTQPKFCLITNNSGK